MGTKWKYKEVMQVCILWRLLHWVERLKSVICLAWDDLLKQEREVLLEW